MPEGPEQVQERITYPKLETFNYLQMKCHATIFTNPLLVLHHDILVTIIVGKSQPLRPPNLQCYPSQLSSQQVHNHLSTSNPSSPPQSREIQGTCESVRISKKKHGWDPSTSILERKTSIVHLVLLYGTATKMMHASLRIYFWFVGAWCVSSLRSH
jgi:hypothetical protein